MPILHIRSRQVWATWEELKPGHSMEGHAAPGEQPQDSPPPIGQLTAFEGQSPECVEEMLKAVGDALCKELGLPGNIFISFTEAKSGQVIAGNGIIRRSSGSQRLTD